MDVDPLERESERLCGGSGEPTALGATLLQRQPYLQAGAGRMWIRFAAADADSMEVRVGRPDAVVPLTAGTGAETPRLPARELIRVIEPRFVGTEGRRLLAVRAIRQRRQTVPAEQFYLVEAELDELEPGTLYCYQVVRGDDAITHPAPFQVAPDAGEGATELVVLGDSGSGSPAQRAIAKRLAEVNFELMVFVGDIAYPSGTAARIQTRFFDVYTHYLREVPVLSALGNHGYRADEGAPFFRAFRFPGNERYYDQRWGDLHIIVLDSNRPTRAQATWLRSVLRSSDAAWKVVFAHHPPFSSSTRGPSPRFRRRFAPIWTAYGVDLVIAGHEHHYERVGPIDGVSYIITGGGGGSLTRVWRSRRTRVAKAVHHYLHLHVEREVLRLRAIDIDGQELDRLTLRSRAP